MKLISHRGNLTGPDKDLENNPNQIVKAIEYGFDVEIDVWLLDNQIYLGHDYPQFIINRDFLLDKPIWCHAKNLFALEFLLTNNITCFWHESDKFTLTSNGFIWTYPNQPVNEKSIIVSFDRSPPKNLNCYGVCSDFVQTWKSENSNLF